MTPDFFDATNGAFRLIAFTRGINKIPNTYGRVRELGVFGTTDPVTVANIAVEEMNGVLNLIPSQPRGAPPNENIMGKRVMRQFTVPRFPLHDVVLPGEVQGVRAFDSENTAETIAGVYARKLAAMRAKHAITLEHLRVKALGGTVLDADGSTIYNWFTEFGITQTAVNFSLTNSATEVLLKCTEAKRAIEAALQGEVMSGVHALCSPEFFDSLVTHANVKNVYFNWQAAADRLGGDNRKGFQFGGITFEEYVGSATEADGTVRKFIPVNEAVIFPMGTNNTFATVYAPMEHNATVNTPGIELYAIGEERRMGQGWDILTEMNALPIVKRPAVLIRATRS